jgi:predicted PurR-regulated permease PerM
MRVLAVVIIILGLASLVLGIIFIPQAASGRQQIADSIAPLTLDKLNAQYDKVSAAFDQFMAQEEPKIQAQQAQPSAMYNYLSAQRAMLGLAKANVGTVNNVRINGIVDIVLGVGFVLIGIVLFRKKAST